MRGSRGPPEASVRLRTLIGCCGGLGPRVALPSCPWTGSETAAFPCCVQLLLALLPPDEHCGPRGTTYSQP
ncbi:hypothetical protein NDU88_000489 [Pleurodeles waltl]|uniref:Uncharacterized protein n=1 Tax=Pleurodeles waltl TaxID=8319 RepID=A0AAV7V584_PLEWA|nr:hypothetical protein NDU88_000489 [Pleurodeles waltl]